MARFIYPLRSDWHRYLPDLAPPEVVPPSFEREEADGQLQRCKAEQPVRASRRTTQGCVAGPARTSQQACQIRRRITGKRPDPRVQCSCPRHSGGAGASRGEPLVKTLAELVLAQQEAIQAHSRACGFLLHLGRAPETSVAAQLISTSQASKQAMEKTPNSVKEPLRVLLLKMLMGSLLGRMGEISAGSELLAWPSLQSLAVTKNFYFLYILGGEKLLKFGEKWAVNNF